MPRESSGSAAEQRPSEFHKRLPDEEQDTIITRAENAMDLRNMDEEETIVDLPTVLEDETEEMPTMKDLPVLDAWKSDFFALPEGAVVIPQEDGTVIVEGKGSSNKDIRQRHTEEHMGEVRRAAEYF
ncbi:hypothetical protein HYV72_00835, partial [Candidatus Uhrbacteria bacterium]|nr:hypothetical protein [Candidatus Uhrbacteria bacterium]